MGARKYDHEVIIERRQSGQDAAGQELDGWARFIATPVSAQIENVTGREYQAAQATQNPVQTRIRIRYRDGITSAMRVVRGSTIYNINAVLDRDGSKRELQLMCTTGVDNG